MTDESINLLIEDASSAFRERSASGLILPSASWFDLPPEFREIVFERQLESRCMERALHPDGFSATVQAVLRRLTRT